MFENLNIAGGIWNSIERWLKGKHPTLVKKYENIYFSKSDYWDKIEKEIKLFCEEQKIEHRIYFHHGKQTFFEIKTLV